MSQANMDLGILQETKLTDGIYTRGSAGYSVIAMYVPSRHRGGVAIKVYRGDFQVTLTLARAPRAQAKKIEEINLGFFPRYLPKYCAAQCSVGFMDSLFCCLIGSNATRLAK